MTYDNNTRTVELKAVKHKVSWEWSRIGCWGMHLGLRARV